ncbi:hypothetical protein IMPR6_60218 [Imperialibacter sp. EC-SDR9]|nr:hypothetical protein IMPR6_60218 [Imperialibacter sp. EC-SDR9]
MGLKCNFPDFPVDPLFTDIRFIFTIANPLRAGLHGHKGTKTPRIHNIAEALAKVGRLTKL